MSVYHSVDDLRREINKFKMLINQGNLNETDISSLIQLYEDTNNINLSEMKEETLQLIEKYLTMLEDTPLEINCNLNSISNEAERLKREIGMPDFPYSILKEVTSLYINYKLRRQGKKATPAVREYLTDLFVYIILKEGKIIKGIDKMRKILKSEGRI